MEVLRQVLAVVVVLGALALALVALRRNGRAGWSGIGRKPAGRLAVVERLTLGPQHTLHLVRFGGRVLLVAAHAGGCTLLETSAGGEHPAGNSPGEPS
jgi:flagellar biogenesis protein FliO